MNKNSLSKCSLDVLKQRAFLLQKIRLYFVKEKVLEVETPILSSAGNTDIHIESFRAEKIDSNFNKSYLRTSPEFPLKRLLCSGIGDVFEIAKVFRKGEISKTHNIEFTMLEWYRINYDYNQLIQDVIYLFEGLFEAFDVFLKTKEIITFNDCFRQQFGIDLDCTSTKHLNDLCKNYDYSGSILSKDEALDYLFATQIQKNLGRDKLVFVTHYPASQAALAEINPDNNKNALRFEVFYQGHELGNGYQELTDAVELMQRFKLDNEKRGVDNAVQIDNNLILAMQKGMPKCSGVAVGVDRLLMVLLKKESIAQVMAFTAENA